jgi:hypothetical protein
VKELNTKHKLKKAWLEQMEKKKIKAEYEKIFY